MDGFRPKGELHYNEQKVMITINLEHHTADIKVVQTKRRECVQIYERH